MKDQDLGLLSEAEAMKQLNVVNAGIDGLANTGIAPILRQDDDAPKFMLRESNPDGGVGKQLPPQELLAQHDQQSGRQHDDKISNSLFHPVHPAVRRSSGFRPRPS
jgi:hypothetical protein